jgi:hypothetical protein
MIGQAIVVYRFLTTQLVTKCIKVVNVLCILVVVAMAVSP